MIPFDPLSAGLSLGLGTISKLQQGQNLKQAFGESIPLVGGIIQGQRVAEEQKAAQADADALIGNKASRFGQTHASNIPRAYGGELDNVTEFDTGGTHEQNPHGGIPQGNNSVEQGEVKVRMPDGDYIFSDRLIYEYANK